MATIQEKAVVLADKGQWDQAHRLVQDHGDSVSCRIHAYLHREEGDMGNARYWYGRAGTNAPELSLAEELDELRALVEGRAEQNG